MAETNTIAIHSRRLATYLMLKDCVLKNVVINKNNAKYLVYMFNDSSYLQENVTRYITNPKIKEEMIELKERM